MHEPLSTAKPLPCELIIRESERDGKSVFAGEPIPGGAFIAPLTGKRVKTSTIDWDTIQVGVMQLDDEWSALETGEVDDFFNHSCDPNLAFTKDGEGFFALRAIASGEELTFDYSTCEDDPDWKIPCLCGASHCRSFITGFSTLDKAQQLRLLPYCRPYLRHRFQDRI